MQNRNPIYVVQHNHFDPTWRRCWDRTFDYKGTRFRSYADLEEYFIDIWMANARRGAVWSEGQAVVFRKYLERNPERLEEMRDLVKKSRIELTAAGETVADTNMPSGETLLRNLVMGQMFFEEAFGVIPAIGWLEDAFGQSAQMPQLFRGVECRQVLKLCYKSVPGPYWRGLDGSVIFTGDAPYVRGVGHCVKIAPCSVCQGIGCDECPSPGLSHTSYITDEELQNALAEEFPEAPFSMLAVGGEEAVPNPRIVDWVEEAKKKTGLDFRFAGFNMISEHLADQITKIDDPNLATPDQIEANPVSTGCYVSRIKIKQEFRRVENLVNAAERWAAIGHLLGAEYAEECLTQAWRDVVFCAFHDAITSTHIDAAYHELMDMLSDAEHESAHVMNPALDKIEESIDADPDKDYLMVYNPECWERMDPVSITVSGTYGQPLLRDPQGNEVEVLDASAEGADVSITFRSRVPALGYVALEMSADAKPIHSGEISDGPGEIENEFFRVRVSGRGIESVIDKRIGEEIFDTSTYLLNELILEEDIGHPWGTMQAPSFAEGLSKYSTGVKIRRAEKVCEVMLTGTYKGDDPNTRILSWRQSMKLYQGSDRIDFTTNIDWDTAQRRIRIAFPTNIKTSDGIYSIPYGAIKRWKYEPDMSTLPSTNGDWPAINWVDLYGEGENRGYALLNTGTPSHKIEDGVIYMSVLRSPTDSWCLNEPEFYDCPDFDGARDAGSHQFDHSLIPHPGDYRAANIERRGRELNNPLMARMLSCFGSGKLGLSHSFLRLDAPENVVVAAIKKAERDDSVLVRLAETAGQAAEASVAVEGAGSKISTVNFLERGEEPVRGKVKVGPFRIVTVKLAK